MLKLDPQPTFKIKVGIPVPGQDKPTQVEFEFRALSRAEMQQWFTDSRDKPDEERIPLIVVGWSGVDQSYSADMLAKMLDRYPGAAGAIVKRFVDELTGARLGN